MSEWDDELSQDELEGDENLNEEPIDESSAVPSEKYEKLLGEDSKKYKLSGMFKDWFLDYSSYVILQRAVPNSRFTRTNHGHQEINLSSSPPKKRVRKIPRSGAKAKESQGQGSAKRRRATRQPRSVPSRVVIALSHGPR